MNPLAPPLVVKGLHLWAQARALLQHLDWQVAVGQRWCVIGRNAAGKSTLLRALAGLPVPRQAGEVAWFGRDAAHWAAADAARVRAYVPQQASDRFNLRVDRLLALSSPLPGAAPPQEAQAVLRALDAEHLATRDVTQLSGGERQRVALVQCRLQGTPLMLLDEPVSFQDPAHQLLVARWLAQQHDRALVFSAHDVNWIAQAATHLLSLHGDGRWEAGTVDEMVASAPLERAYGCGWRREGGLWCAC
ncbi:ABC-type cobalamin/Fe3+-siderophore transport system, ATPase component [Burkholderiales bacterium JOSHI_001]|nr:ABC-type cobalamin/Fe3+-siderophore transport system, ATPase component [Burkholderiales bacterium JOSHI_001]